MVGTEPEEDAVAGAGLGDDDLSGTEVNGDGIGSIAARVCANGPTTRGIDVSYYQGVIDWPRVKAGGIDFAFIRVSDGARFRDPKFGANWQGAKSAGVIRGVYQFFRPGQNIAQQAQIVIDAIGRYTPGDLPPVIDVEATGGLAPATIAARIREWVDLVKAGTGASPIVYTGKYFWRDEVGGARGFSDHPLWIAQYTQKCPDLPAPWTRWMFWQHTDRGRIDGIRANVDLNHFNGTLADLQAYAGGTVDPAAINRAAALPFHWLIQENGTYDFVAMAPANVARVEIRVEDYLIGAATPAGGIATLNYRFNAQRNGRTVEVRGLDANGATVAVGNGLVDSTATPEAYVHQTGELEYEIGLEYWAGAATVEVYADTFPLADAETGLTRSTRGAVRYTWTQGGERELKIISRDAKGNILRTVNRTLHIR